MIKRIIFDVDNTLIDFPEYKEGYEKVLKQYNINKSAKDLYDAIGYYDNHHKDIYYNKKELLETINFKLNTNLPSSFLEDYLDMYNNLKIEVNNDTKETLEYLSKKYELVVLSNWFTDSQEKRLEITKIRKYFKEIYGADKLPMKPNKDSYLKAMGRNDISECIMIGDSIEFDIEVPDKLGMKTILLNNEQIKTNYKTINKISDLKEIL